jgi:hypothetical protein
VIATRTRFKSGCTSRTGTLVRLACSLAFFAAGPAHADRPQSFSLSLVRAVGAESCTNSLELARLLERSLGPVLVAPSEAQLAIEVALSRDASVDAWRARVVVSDTRGAVLGERALRSYTASCRALDAQLVLVVAMAIDPELVQRGLPSELAELFAPGDDVAEQLLSDLRAQNPAPAATQPASAAPASAPVSAPAGGHRARGDEPSAAAPHRPNATGTRVWLGAALGLGLGQLPSPALGPVVAVRVELGAWPIGLALTYFPRNDAPLVEPTRRGDAVGFSLASALLTLCPAFWQVQNAELNACVGWFVALRQAHADALVVDAGARSLELGPALGADGQVQLSDPFWLWASAAGQLQLGRDRYGYLDEYGAQNPLFAPTRVAFMGQLGVRARL